MMAAVIWRCHTHQQRLPPYISQQGATVWRGMIVVATVCTFSLQPVDSRQMYGQWASITWAAWLLSGWRSARCCKPSSGILVLIDMTTSDTGCLLSHHIPDVLYRTQIWWIHVLPQGMGGTGRSLPSFLVPQVIWGTWSNLCHYQYPN